MTAALRFALIGCGVIGQVHARSIAALGAQARLVLTVDAVADRAEKFATEYGVERGAEYGAGRGGARGVERGVEHWTSDCRRARSRRRGRRRRLHASGLHAEMAIAALNAGKHVVVEKPLDVTVEAVRRVEAARLRAGQTVTVISQHRFDPASQLVHRAVRAGQLGRLTSGVASVAWWRSQDYYVGDWRGTWRLDGGGARMNQGSRVVRATGAGARSHRAHMNHTARPRERART